MPYRCKNKCGKSNGFPLIWSYQPDQCPQCGGKIVHFVEKDVDKNQHSGIYFHNRWTPQMMQVGLDKVYCPTKQSYLDACKHGRVIHAGTRHITTREIDPVGAKD